MKTIFQVIALATLCSVLLVNVASAQPTPSPGAEYVWEQGYTLEDGTVVEGFWRKAEEPGYQWVEAMWLEDGTFVEPHWEPVSYDEPDYVWEHGFRDESGVYYKGYWRPAVRDGFVWVPGHYVNGVYVWGRWHPVVEGPADHIYVEGHVGPDGYWVNGFWRPRVMVGYSWIDGYWYNGAYHWGYWQPLTPRVGYTWVPGHIGLGGVYVMGFWRPTTYVGFVWSGGYYAHGAWYWGCWSPLTVAVGMVWTPGYVSNGYWVAGYWRPAHKPGHSWVDGYYAGGTYHKGYWAKGTTVSYPQGATPVKYASGYQGKGASPKVQYASEKAPKGYKPVRYADVPKDAKSLAALNRRHTTYNQHKALYQDKLDRKHAAYNASKDSVETKGRSQSDNQQRQSGDANVSREQAHRDYNRATNQERVGNYTRERAEKVERGQQADTQREQQSMSNRPTPLQNRTQSSHQRGTGQGPSHDLDTRFQGTRPLAGTSRVQPTAPSRDGDTRGGVGETRGSGSSSRFSGVESGHTGTYVKPSQNQNQGRKYHAPTQSPSPRFNRPSPVQKRTQIQAVPNSSGRSERGGNSSFSGSSTKRPSSYVSPPSSSRGRSSSVQSAPRSSSGSRPAARPSRGGRSSGR